MAIFKNVMESVVEMKYEEIKGSLNSCKCERCRADVIAFALNRLPPKYVVTHEGELYTKVNLFGDQYRVKILSALAQGSRIVAANPSHVPENADKVSAWVLDPTDSVEEYFTSEHIRRTEPKEV